MACAAAMCAPLAAHAQTATADSVMQHVSGNRLSIGGYGEVALSRNFYSDSGNRYSSASSPMPLYTLATTLARVGHSAPRSSLSTAVPVLP